MTASEQFRRRRRVLMAIFVAGVAVFCGSVLGTELLGNGDWLWVTYLIGFGIASLALMGAYYFAFLCPECEGNLGPLFVNSMSRRPVRYCPYCGSDLDTLNDED